MFSGELQAVAIRFYGIYSLISKYEIFSPFEI